jgi:hypothetical protein
VAEADMASVASSKLIFELLGMTLIFFSFKQ